MSRPIHETVARRWWVVRLASQAGVGAVIGSAVALALGAPPWLHLVAIAVAAVAAGAWPIRRDERRALLWVAERSGLAYETAWEHARGDAVGSSASAADPAAALRAAVAVQGRLAVRDLRPPPMSAWWLPLLTLAVGMWAWSWLVTPGGPTSPATPGTGPTPPAPSAPGPATPDPLVPDEPEEAAPPTVDTEDASGAEPGADDGGDGAAGAAGTGSDGAASERDALERFLDSIRERPELTEEERRAAEAAMAAERSDEEGDGEPEAEAALQPSPGDDRDADRDGEEVAGEGDAEGEDGGAEAGDEEGATDGEEGEEVAGSGVDEAGEPGEDGSEGDGAPGETEAGGPEEGDAEGAGLGIGAEHGGAEGVDAAGEDPEALPSILGPGPEQAVGGVQLPGVAPEGDAFPAGAAGTPYRRAVEQALGEGEVPVPYQEVIRNYFR
jgi:hypothetical protein